MSPLGMFFFLVYRHGFFCNNSLLSFHLSATALPDGMPSSPVSSSSAWSSRMKRFVSIFHISPPPKPYLSFSFFKIKDATSKIKELADVRTQSMDDVDSLLRL